MIIPTHRLVGKYVYKMLSNKEKEKLNYIHFLWGNMLPDISPNYKKISHYYPANKEYVFGLLDYTFENELKKSEYSVLLGVLIHFLCDYTCIYHNNMTINEQNSMRRHMQYEMMLHLFTQTKVRSHIPEIIAFNCLEDVKYHIYMVIERANLPEIIPDIKVDFYDMMQISISVVNFLLKKR